MIRLTLDMQDLRNLLLMHKSDKNGRYDDCLLITDKDGKPHVLMCAPYYFARLTPKDAQIEHDPQADFCYRMHFDKQFVKTLDNLIKAYNCKGELSITIPAEGNGKICYKHFDTDMLLMEVNFKTAPKPPDLLFSYLFDPVEKGRSYKQRIALKTSAIEIFDKVLKNVNKSYKTHGSTTVVEFIPLYLHTDYRVDVEFSAIFVDYRIVFLSHALTAWEIEEDNEEKRKLEAERAGQADS